jgi:hypothetical protein
MIDYEAAQLFGGAEKVRKKVSAYVCKLLGRIDVREIASKSRVPESRLNEMLTCQICPSWEELGRLSHYLYIDFCKALGSPTPRVREISTRLQTTLRAVRYSTR